ncbi:hypothetical protein [Vibrio navarrensis]|uniref:hypothetical protein n=1 Tax=Vibrio navarrensis TaxID=29495 RepID=UPI00192F3360|nr:hypothetical protein [Vibrio navarrensis]
MAAVMPLFLEKNLMKQMLIALCVALFSCVALAVEPMTAEEAGLIMGAIHWIAGEYYALVIVILFAIGFLWAQLRQLISPELLAKAPNWIIVILESIAANRGHAKNELDKNPLSIKRMR